MALKTAEQYVASIKDDREFYLDGSRVEDITTHPRGKFLVEATAMDFEMALDPRYHDLLTEALPDGEQVHFTFVAPKSKEDLIRRRKVIQETMHVQGMPGGAKFTGIDGLNGLHLACARIDNKLGTEYSKRVAKYRRHLMDIDAAIAVAMTDVKGNRTSHPHQQKGHQDYYLRMVSKGNDGIVVRGAKAHISFAPTSNEMVVLPCRAMTPGDGDYAVAFATPTNAKGIKMIGNAHDGMHPVVVFDDVFVPMERVFLAGEWQHAHEMPYSFATYHRLSADTYKYAQLEVQVGCAALLAEYNGLEKVGHVRDKLSWLVMYCEGTEALGKAAVENCEYDESGTPYPNTLYSNVAKFFFASNYYTAEQYLQDIAGGLVSTLPSLEDLKNPATSEYVKKYLGTGDIVEAENRMKAFKLAQSLCSFFEGNVTIHAEGSMAAQKMMLYAIADWQRYKAWAKHAAGIPCDHPAVKGIPRWRLYSEG
jgi:4-hydroxybutyryl-CoA dehydratase / vinylacetyl-CoA-Delta-isomerase